MWRVARILHITREARLRVFRTGCPKRRRMSVRSVMRIMIPALARSARRTFQKGPSGEDDAILFSLQTRTL